MSSYIILLVIILIYLCYTWMKKKYSYWKDRGIKGPTPWPVVGNFATVMTFKESHGNFVKRIYNEFPNENIVGVYQALKPTIILRDPEMIKKIFIKDFAYFQDRGVKFSKNPINDHLFAAEGETWRILRHKLTPIFTSGKIKGMIPLIEKCVNELIDYVDSFMEESDEHEIRTLASQYTLEVIGSTVFGVEMDAFNKKKNIFRENAEKISSPTNLSRVVDFLNDIIPGTLKLAEKLNIGHAEETKSFFIDFVHKVIKQREGKPKMRKDFMDLMIELKEQGLIEKKENNKLSQIEMCNGLIVAQASIFYAAGFDTSSATMSFLIHELAHHQDIQDRIFREICEVENKYGKITYESLAEMTYLQMALHETLRKYPAAAVLLRKAKATYTFPGSNSTIEKGTPVMIPVSGLHHDPQYFKNPDDFDPERFSPENKKKILQCTYLPFGAGPRQCIGKRFATVQSMFGITGFLKHCKVEPTDKTERKLNFDPRRTIPTSDKGIWVKISRRSKF